MNNFKEYKEYDEDLNHYIEITPDNLNFVKRDIVIDKIQRMAEALLEKEENKILEEHQ